MSKEISVIVNNNEANVCKEVTPNYELIKFIGSGIYDHFNNIRSNENEIIDQTLTKALSTDSVYIKLVSLNKEYNTVEKS